MVNKTNIPGIIAIVLALFVIAGCPDWETSEKISEIKVFLNGAEQTGISIESGQTLNLTASAGTGHVSIVWEIDDIYKDNAEITDTGEGTDCTLRGKAVGAAELRIRAWLTSEAAVKLILPVTVKEAVVTDIVLTGDSRIGIGENRALSAEITPAWAAYNITWEIKSNPNNAVDMTDNNGIFTIKGNQGGTVTITGKAGGFSKDFSFEIKQPEPLTGIDIYIGNTRVTGSTVDIGVFEEKFLSAGITPAGVYTFFNWESETDDVTIQADGTIKGITPNGSSKITVRASGIEAWVNVKVGNPVTGVRVRYNDNSDNLGVTNIIWLFPGDSVNLRAELMPDGIDGEISWSGGAGAVELAASSGGTNTITGRIYDDFEAQPVLITVSAANDSNGTRPAVVYLRVKVLRDEPIWAWDRARDSDLNTHLKIYADDYDGGNYKPGIPDGSNPREDAEEWKIGGRGEMAATMQNVINGNPIPYTQLGLNINSSGEYGTNVPPAFDPAPTPGNSTRIMIGTNINEETSPNNHVPGIFDFLTPNKAIRISVDYEILSSNGRAMWITVNNKQPTHGQSVLGNSARLIQYPLELTKGTKNTLVQVLNVPDLFRLDLPGFYSLESAFVGIIVLSRGGNINVSGIRIEYEN